MKTTNYKCDICLRGFDQKQAAEHLFGFLIRDGRTLAQAFAEKSDRHICQQCINDIAREFPIKDGVKLA